MSSETFTLTAEVMGVEAVPETRWQRALRWIRRRPAPTRQVQPVGTVPVVFDYVNEHGHACRVYMPAARVDFDAPEPT